MEKEIWIINGVEVTTAYYLSRIAGVTKKTIYKWVELGMPAYKSEINTFVIPLREAVEWIELYRSKVKPRRPFKR